MNLNQYLAETEETDAAFGGRAGLSQSQINRLKRGVSQPSFDAIKKIAAATGGKVAFEDWAKAVPVTDPEPHPREGPLMAASA